MKKHGFLALLVAALLLLAPAATADDGSLADTFENLLGQLVALFSGDDQPELGMAYPPGGDAVTAEGDEPELGFACPPGG